MDWNADGKKDLLTGGYDGKIRLYLNTNTDEDPVFTGYTFIQLASSDFKCSDGVSVPWIVDWNNDGKKDLICGEEVGKVYLLINEGTNAAPVFNSSSFIQNGASDLKVQYRSGPTVVDWNRDGKKDLIVGSEYGYLWFYENKGTDSDPVFDGHVEMKAGGSVIPYSRTRPTVTDWDNDGVMDIILGIESYTTQTPVYYFHAIGPLFLSNNELRETTAGTVDFTIDAGVENAGDKYFLACSISGTSPGKTLPGGLVLPCTWDFVSALVIPYNNIAFFFDFIGTLDANGQTFPRFEWPGYPGSAGLIIYFAGCTIYPFDFVTNGAAVKVVP